MLAELAWRFSQPDGSLDIVDLVLAADTLIYIRDLDMLTGLLTRVLKPGGGFLFTIGKGVAGSGFRLTRSGRYSHTEDYLRDIADSRLQVVDSLGGMLRVESGVFAEGRAWRLVRPQA